VDLGSGVSIDIEKTNIPVRIRSKTVGEKPKAPEAETNTVVDGLNIKVTRTPLQYEPLGDIIDEFPDFIRDTINSVLQNKKSE
jgi:hypothetical protein